MARRQERCNNRSNTYPMSNIIVRCVSPRLNDPKELYTLILFSLRHLFGDFESHSFGMIVEFCNIDKELPLEQSFDKNQGDKQQYFSIRCSSESISAIRASLTIVTPPQFLEDKLYQFDVIKVYNL